MITKTINELQPITLSRDVAKHIKRGHRWVFADCFEQPFKAKNGLGVLSYKKEALAIGIIQADTNLRFRILTTIDRPGKNYLDYLSKYIEQAWKNVLDVRSSFPNNRTNCFRLINGEGDGFPGLIIDIYGDTAVIKHDHPSMEKIWDHEVIAKQLKAAFPVLRCVYLKRRNDVEEKGKNIFGVLMDETIFQENEVKFHSQIRDAAKTGFFLDQRDNRAIIERFSKGKTVLNLFSYTGGFSLYAAKGGATEITSVDIAPAAIAAIEKNYVINEFKNKRENICADAFEFIKEQIAAKNKYDLVITDPPSFAPNQKAIASATEAYIRVYSDSIKLVKDQGLFAASSCSAHISFEAFLEIVRESFSKARKKATLIYLGGQPFDHPYPLAMDELRYLKFALLRVE